MNIRFHPLECNFFKKNKLYEKITNKEDLKNDSDYIVLFELSKEYFKDKINKECLVIGDVFYEQEKERIWVFSFYKNNHYSVQGKEIQNYSSSINGFGFICYKMNFEPYRYSMKDFFQTKNLSFIGNIFLKIKTNNCTDLINLIKKGSINYHSLVFFNRDVDILFYDNNDNKHIYNYFNDTNFNYEELFNNKSSIQIRLTKKYQDNFFNKSEVMMYQIVNLIKKDIQPNKYIKDELVAFSGSLFKLNSICLNEEYKKEIVEILKEKYHIFIKKTILDKDILDAINYYKSIFIIINEDGIIDYVSSNFSKKEYSFDLLNLLQPNRRLIYQEIEYSLINEYYLEEYLKLIYLFD